MRVTSWVILGAHLVQVGVKIWLLGQFKAHIWRKLGSKSCSWAILGAKKTQEAGKAPPRDRGPNFGKTPVARFCKKLSMFTSALGSHFGAVVCSFLAPFLKRFLGDFGTDLGPFWGPKTDQEEPQEQPKSSQDECAAENAAKAKTCVSPRRELTFWVLEWPKTRLS